MTEIDAVKDDGVWWALDKTSAINSTITTDKSIADVIQSNKANKFLVGAKVKKISGNEYSCTGVEKSAETDYFIFVQRGLPGQVPPNYSILKLGHIIQLESKLMTSTNDFDEGKKSQRLFK